jgi:hypothetical protein
MMVVVWFLAICSIVVHGLSIPLGKLGFFLPRTLSRVFTGTNSDDANGTRVSFGSARENLAAGVRERRKKLKGGLNGTGSGTSTPKERVNIYKASGSVATGEGNGSGIMGQQESSGGRREPERTIRFPDDEGMKVGVARE